MEWKHVGKRKMPQLEQPSSLVFSTMESNLISDDFKKIKLNSSSASTDLPGSILIDIISRLSLKTLFDFRRVCKSWRSLFSEPYFYNLYSSHTPTTLILQLKFNSLDKLQKLHIIDQQTASLTTIIMNQITVTGSGSGSGSGVAGIKQFQGTRFQVGNACNGLICLREVQTREPFLVWNPILGQFVVIPKPAIISDNKVVSGFGFCSTSNKYKVLRIFHKKNDPLWKQRAQIYQLGVGDKWKDIGEVLLPLPSRYPGFFTNNSLHWILDYNNIDATNKIDIESHILWSKVELIVGFDFVEEKFKPISSPPIFSVEQKHKYHWSNLGIIGSNLSICAIHSVDFRPDVQVWVMEEYGVQDSWTLRLSIRDPAVEWWNPYRWMQLTNFAKNGEIFMLCGHCYVFAYNLENREFRKIEVLDFPAIAHFPSFISLEDVMNEHNGTGSLKVCYL